MPEPVTPAGFILSNRVESDAGAVGADRAGGAPGRLVRAVMRIIFGSPLLDVRQKMDARLMAGDSQRLPTPPQFSGTWFASIQNGVISAAEVAPSSAPMASTVCGDIGDPAAGAADHWSSPGFVDSQAFGR